MKFKFSPLELRVYAVDFPDQSYKRNILRRYHLNGNFFAGRPVNLTPKNVFHLVQSLYGIRKNAVKIFAFG